LNKKLITIIIKTIHSSIGLQMMIKRNLIFKFNYLQLLILLLTLLLSPYSHATNNHKKADYAIGLNTGWVVANGILVRKYVGNYYLQTTFAGLVDRNENQEFIDVSISTGNYFPPINIDFINTNTHIKTVFGFEVKHDKRASRTESAPTSNEINTGFGLGVEFGNIHRNGLVLSANTIYTATFTGFKEWKFSQLGLKPSIGIIYNF